MEKKNTGLIVFIVILLLLVLGLGGFIVYDKVLSDKTTDNKNNNGTSNTSCPTENQYKYDVSKRKQTQVIKTQYLQVIVDTAGDAYVSVIAYPKYSGNEKII